MHACSAHYRVGALALGGGAPMRRSAGIAILPTDKTEMELVPHSEAVAGAGIMAPGIAAGAASAQATACAGMVDVPSQPVRPCRSRACCQMKLHAAA